MTNNSSSRGWAACVRRAILGLTAITLFATLPAAADETTTTSTVGRVQIDPQPVQAVYYFRRTDESGWGAAGCPSAGWAYVYATEPGFEALLAAVLQARQNGKVVSFWGNCTGGDYFKVEGLYLWP